MLGFHIGNLDFRGIIVTIIVFLLCPSFDDQLDFVSGVESFQQLEVDPIGGRYIITVVKSTNDSPIKSR